MSKFETRARQGLKQICLFVTSVILGASTVALTAQTAVNQQSQSAQPQAAAFGPANPFYAASTLPFQAPPFDKIKD